MSWTVSRHLFWAILFIGSCTAAPNILTSNHSCPCTPSSECPDHSQHLLEGGQVTISPCESEHLIRCCSVISRPIEPARTNGSSQSDDQKEESVEKKDIKEGLIEELMQFGKNTDENLKEHATIENSLLKEKFEEQKDIKEDLITELILFTKTGTSDSTNTDENMKEYRKTENSPLKEIVTTVMNARRELPLQQHVSTQRSSRQFPEPPPVRYRIFNEASSNASSSIRFPEEMQEEMPEVSLTAQELDLIDKVTSFESTKTSPRKRDAFQVKESKEKKEENVTGKINPLFPRRTIFNKDHRSNVNVKSLSVAKSPSEKMSNFFKRKTSLETSLTLDGVSTRATNENAKPRSIRARLRNDDTSIRNLSHPEGAKNVKRAVRSYVFSKFGNVK